MESSIHMITCVACGKEAVGLGVCPNDIIKSTGYELTDSGWLCNDCRKRGAYDFESDNRID